MRALLLRRLPCLVLSAVSLCGLLCPRGATAQEAQSQTRAAEKYADRIRAFEEFVRVSMQGDRIPGMTVGFAWGDDIWVEGFGFADLEHKVPAKPESAYRLASILTRTSYCSTSRTTYSPSIRWRTDARR